MTTYSRNRVGRIDRALDHELQLIVAELVRRLAIALRDGNLDAARRLWNDGELTSQIDLVLR
jgi:hypothetical protein